ncbi:MAG: YidH family protein [Arachnia sp.]
MNQSNHRTWLTRRLFPGGTEPDPRFSLANERTFLAWIRTSMALLGGGVALEAFAQEALPTQLRHAAALTLLVTSLIVSIYATWRWHRVEAAMRHDRPLPVPGVMLAVAFGLIVASALLLVVVLGWA